jgi:hypothetical protein
VQRTDNVCRNHTTKPHQKVQRTVILKPGHVDIPVRCTYKNLSKMPLLQTFRGAAAGLIEIAE